MRWAFYLPSLVLFGLILGMQAQMGRWLFQHPWVRSRTRRRLGVLVAALVSCGWLILGFAAGIPRFLRQLPASPWLPWMRASALAWALITLGLFFAFLVWRQAPRFDPGRRKALRAAGGAIAASPFLAAGFGTFVERTNLRVPEIRVPVPGLPKDLDGLKLVQLSDIHLSPFLSESELARAVAMANETKPHLAFITGDLITSASDPLDACLKWLSRLKADAGILGCLGNHEMYARAVERVTVEGRRLGIDFLRGAARQLRFGGAVLNVGGVDYQPFHSRYLRGAGSLVAPGAINVLLSHNPDVFPVAARQGWNLTLAGHTHGGQVNVEILNQSLNFARFFTPFVYGLYAEGNSAAYVTRGIGTVGVPARLGAPPEIALIRLCAT